MVREKEYWLSPMVSCKEGAVNGERNCEMGVLLRNAGEKQSSGVVIKSGDFLLPKKASSTGPCFHSGPCASRSSCFII